MTEEAALLAAIRDHPDDDTPRLVYADWLQENDEPVACPGCSGKGARQSGHVRCDVRGIHDSRTSTPCPRCGGSGRVPGGRADRAEFIRVQCRVPTLRLCDPVCSQEYGHGPRCQLGERDALVARGRELLAAHPEWSRCECGRCEVVTGHAHRMVYHHRGPDSRWDVCETCGGSSDLFVLDRSREDETLTEGPRPRKLTWDRGFVGGVELRGGECWQTERTQTYPRDQYGPAEYETYTVPTPLLLALVRQVPTLRRVWVPDAELLGESQHLWWASSVPEGVRRWLDHSYPSRELAADALALAVPRWARLTTAPEVVL